MFFDLGNGIIWRADSWLFISAAGGDVSILMTQRTILAFSHFVRSIVVHPKGHAYVTSSLKFCTESIYNKDSVNIMIGGDDFIYTFNISLTKLEDLSNYLLDNSEDAFEEEDAELLKMSGGR